MSRPVALPTPRRRRHIATPQTDRCLLMSLAISNRWRKAERQRLRIVPLARIKGLPNKTLRVAGR